MTQARRLVVCIDRSTSMRENDPVLGMPKEEAVYRAINGWKQGEQGGGFRSLADFIRSNELDSMDARERASHSYLGFCYFGEAGFSDSKSYVLPILEEGRTLASIAEIRERLLSSGDAEIIPRSAYYGVNSDGTDLGQLEKGAITLIQEPGEHKIVKTSLLVYSDGCFNRYRGRGVSSTEELLQRLSEARSSILAAAQQGVNRRFRGILFLIFGDENEFEVDTGICPLRAALLAGKRSEQGPAMRGAVEKLLRQGIISVGRDWDSIEVPEVDVGGVRVGGGVLSEYNVFRLDDPFGLAKIIFFMTTQAGPAAPS